MEYRTISEWKKTLCPVHSVELRGALIPGRMMISDGREFYFVFVLHVSNERPIFDFTFYSDEDMSLITRELDGAEALWVAPHDDVHYSEVQECNLRITLNRWEQIMEGELFVGSSLRNGIKVPAQIWIAV